MTHDPSKRDDSLFNAFKGIFNPHPMTIEQKIQEISIDAKQAEQIQVMFDMGFEMGLAFGQTSTVKRTDADYIPVRKLYVETAGPMMVMIFEDIMKDYEKTKKDGD